MDFRHVDSGRIFDESLRTVMMKGLANIAFADGHVKALGPNAVTDAMFTRD